jgi:hypothetical protein
MLENVESGTIVGDDLTHPGPTCKGETAVDGREFFGADPRRELGERLLGAGWIVDGTSREAQVRWYPQTGEVVVVDRGRFEVWALEVGENTLARFQADVAASRKRRVSCLRSMLAAARSGQVRG